MDNTVEKTKKVVKKVIIKKVIKKKKVVKESVEDVLNDNEVPVPDNNETESKEFDSYSICEDDIDELPIRKKKKKVSKLIDVKESSSEDLENVSCTEDLSYEFYLNRIYSQMAEDGISVNRDRLTIPIPELSFVGSKRTQWSNFEQTCQVLSRDFDHVLRFLKSELQCDISIGNENKLMIRGRFRIAQIQSVLKKYTSDFVFCKVCKSHETKLSKASGLTKITCKPCGSERYTKMT